jgi:tetratricopeptide (TPR) repeat protein
VISEHPQRIKDDPDTYVTVLNSIIFYGSVLSKVKESQKAFDTLREFLDLYPEKHHKLFVAYDNMMALYITAGRFRDGLPFADKAASELKAHEEKLFASNKVALYHDMFYTYFGCRKYHQSLEWLNKLLNETGLKSREDIQVTARLTNLIVHYELQHYELLPYLLRSTQTFLRKRKRLHTVEKVLLRFMNRLLKVSADDKREMRQLFSEIKSALEIVTRNPDEAKVLTEYFDYVSWLESKIRNRPFEKVVRDKALITKTNFS